MAFDSMDKVLAALKGSDKNEIPDSVLKYVNKPNKAWSILKSRQTVKRLQPMDPRTPKPPDHTRFVCISDTHGRTNRIAQDLPEGDVLIHAGDFTMVGKPNEVSAFNEFLGSLSYPHKVVIAGNHDISFDPPSCETLWRMFSREPYGDPLEIKSTLTNCIYLEDSMVEINGIQIYGSPWQVKCNTSLQLASTGSNSIRNYSRPLCILFTPFIQFFSVNNLTRHWRYLGDGYFWWDDDDDGSDVYDDDGIDKDSKGDENNNRDDHDIMKMMRNYAIDTVWWWWRWWYSHISMCCPKGYHFWAFLVWNGIGYRFCLSGLK